MNEDGSLSHPARALLRFISSPFTPELIAEELGQPLYRVRGGLRELMDAGLVTERDGLYVRTEKGTAALTD
ncbi:MAG TPA: hypothetical protein PK014_05580 [Thermoanaerobaculia bacterium]|nr:hypothetical protein [Thermoanaerobaculia bacterium]HUM28705.1 hypothetical protein [Thermoanaerobaculia bacterium]HXK68046.1 hypothetical protein [Thermoanaerobaculia bacterium]